MAGSAAVSPVDDPVTYENPDGRVSEIESTLMAPALGLLIVIVYPLTPPAGVVASSAVFVMVSGSVPSGENVVR